MDQEIKPIQYEFNMYLISNSAYYSKNRKQATPITIHIKNKI